MLLRSGLAACFLFSSFAFAQSFEASVSGGRSDFTGNKSLGTIGFDPNGPQYKMVDGFRLAFRITLNQGRFFGHEVGYAYNHTSLEVPAGTTTTGLGGQTVVTPAQDVSMRIHQGFYDFLVYGTPEVTKIRSFAAGGVQFSSFVPPGASVSYGTQTTKYGFNYGFGAKARITSIWGIRFDVRWYNTSKPFDISNQTGRLQQLEIAGGISFNL